MRNDQFNGVLTFNYNFLGRNESDIGYSLENEKANVYSARSGPV